MPTLASLFTGGAGFLKYDGDGNLVADYTSEGSPSAPSFLSTGKTGATTSPGILAGGTNTGAAPTTGAHVVGELVIGHDGHLWVCTAAGTPGTWVRAVSAATLTADGDLLTRAAGVPARLTRDALAADAAFTAAYGPWMATVSPWTEPTSGNATEAEQSASSVNGGYRQFVSAVQNNAVTWRVALTAGTWRLDLRHLGNTNGGIASITLNGAAVGTADAYAAALVWVTTRSFPGIVVPTTAVVPVTLTISTRHASSTGWQFWMSHLSLTRTA